MERMERRTSDKRNENKERKKQLNVFRKMEEEEEEEEEEKNLKRQKEVPSRRVIDQLVSGKFISHVKLEYKTTWMDWTISMNDDMGGKS